MSVDCTLEASVDGIHWQQLAEVNNDVAPVKGTWQSDGAKSDGTATVRPITHDADRLKLVVDVKESSS